VYESLVAARVLHVLGVVVWIGGVAFVTTVLIPALRRLPEAERRLWLFEMLEGRFALQARWVTALTGLSGLYMVTLLGAWSRYLEPGFWWMHLMMLVWIVFTLVLFVLEPLFLHRWFHARAERDSESAFRLLQVMHWVLLGVSLIAVVGAVAGTRGLL
jgi:uncharacterized membrane protein